MTLTVSDVQIGLRAINDLAPDTAWSIASDGTVHWHDTSTPPTQAAIDDKLAELSAPTVAHVKAEAQRRIIAMTGAADLTDCIIKQSNANMRANELNDLRITENRAHTPEEAAEAAALRALAAAIKAVRAASDALEAMSPIPADYTDNDYWT